MLATNPHWHLDYDRDNPTEMYPDVWSLLNGIEWQLNSHSDYLFESADCLGENEQWEEAWKTHKLQQSYDGVLSNVRNMLHQHESEFAERAPIYRDPETSDTLLLQAVDRILEMVETETRLSWWECVDECEVDPDEEDIWEKVSQ